MKRCALLIIMIMSTLSLWAKADCAQFGACVVCTFTDDFTDEVTAHELQCSGSDAFSNIESFLQPGQIVVGCTQQTSVAYASLTKMQGGKFPNDHHAQIKYRFDEDKAYIGEWATQNPTGRDNSIALTLIRELAYDIASGVYRSERLLYEVDGFRSVVTFSQPDTQGAVSELEKRCGLE